MERDVSGKGCKLRLVAGSKASRPGFCYTETTDSVVVASSHNTPPHTSSVVAFHLVCCVLNMLVSGRRTFASTSAIQI